MNTVHRLVPISRPTVRSPNLEPSLAVPVASDVQLSPSWKAITGTPGAKLGKRILDAFLHRPSEELYGLRTDPDEVVNLAVDPQIGRVKDMGSAAVGLALLIAGMAWLLALAERFVLI